MLWPVFQGYEKPKHHPPSDNCLSFVAYWYIYTRMYVSTNMMFTPEIQRALHMNIKIGSNNINNSGHMNANDQLLYHRWMYLQRCAQRGTTSFDAKLLFWKHTVGIHFRGKIMLTFSVSEGPELCIAGTFAC